MLLQAYDAALWGQCLPAKRPQGSPPLVLFPIKDVQGATDMTSRNGLLASGMLLAVLTMAGCIGPNGAKSACEVFSPATVTVPTSQNDQRVATNATGVQSEAGAKEQNCN